MTGHDALRDLLPDDFSKDLLRASLRAADDHLSPLRRTFFSLGMREMVGHVLRSLAPDDEVKGCCWYRPEADAPTRQQRAKYIVQGAWQTS